MHIFAKNHPSYQSSSNQIPMDFKHNHLNPIFRLPTRKTKGLGQRIMNIKHKNRKLIRSSRPNCLAASRIIIKKKAGYRGERKGIYTIWENGKSNLPNTVIALPFLPFHIFSFFFITKIEK